MPVDRGVCSSDDSEVLDAKGLLAKGSSNPGKRASGSAAASIKFVAAPFVVLGTEPDASGTKAAAVSNTRTTSSMRGLQSVDISV